VRLGYGSDVRFCDNLIATILGPKDDPRDYVFRDAEMPGDGGVTHSFGLELVDFGQISFDLF
jgi:hypothetical protein